MTGYLKGQTHAHSSGSDDSQTPPEQVARHYAARGYDFLVLTDHDNLTPPPPPEGRLPLLVLPGVELTQNYARCTPLPAPGGRCPLHVNALLVSGPPGPIAAWPEPPDPSRLAIYQRALERARTLGGLAQLNHPNYHYAADAALITELARRGVLLLEIANQSGDVDNDGDAGHVSAEALWDAALSAGVTLYGVASDDAHHYDDAAARRAAGQPVFTADKGFVMVHAPRDPAAIRAALERGDFYSSTGVLLAGLGVTDQALVVQVAPERGRSYRVTCIGLGGRVLQETAGPVARCPRPARAPNAYVRARVTDDRGLKAWVQPVR